MRVTAGNATTVLVSLSADQGGHTVAASADWAGRSYLMRNSADTGIVLLKRGLATDDPASIDMSDAFRHDFSKAQLMYTLEPGVALFVKRNTADVIIDILEGGER